MVLREEPRGRLVREAVPDRDEAGCLGGGQNLPPVVGVSVEVELAPEERPLPEGFDGAKRPVGLPEAPDRLHPLLRQDSPLRVPVAHGQVGHEGPAFLLRPLVEVPEKVLLSGDDRFEAVGFSGKKKGQEAVDGRGRLDRPADERPVGLEEIQGQVAVEVRPFENGGEGLPVEAGGELAEGMETSPEDRPVRTEGPEFAGELLEGRLKEGGDRPPAVRTEGLHDEETRIRPFGQMAQDLFLGGADALHAGPRKKGQKDLLDLPDFPEPPGGTARLLLLLPGGGGVTAAGEDGGTEARLFMVGMPHDRQDNPPAPGGTLPEVPPPVPGQMPQGILLPEGRKDLVGIGDGAGNETGGLARSPVADLHPELEAEALRQMGEEGHEAPVDLGRLLLVEGKHVHPGQEEDPAQTAAVAHQGRPGKAGEIEETMHPFLLFPSPTPHDGSCPGDGREGGPGSSPPPFSGSRTAPEERGP
ncbi:MAG: hypothetical protein D084_Lepto4C00496G0001 [Leptospirillum sp. Group IV 'UBA BS']|nr:MAG: hypothetical protein D084_Lepto4C00496G0001 [Leptospirillum sp. Group IV 'UBA BS']